MGACERRKEEERIVAELQANGYPRKFIQSSSRKIIRNRHDNEERKSEHIATAVVPYIDGLSQSISRVLRKADIRTVMKPKKWTLSVMAGAKDSIQAQDDPGVIYALGCKECENVFISETNRTARQRVRKHKCHTRTGRP